MESIAREQLSVLKRAVENIGNIESGVITMMHCRLNSECEHTDHEMGGCPRFMKVYGETCDIARPMLDYAKEMVAKALVRFERTLDDIVQSLPADMPEDEVWDTAIQMIEGGVYNAMTIVADARGIATFNL